MVDEVLRSGIQFEGASEMSYPVLIRIHYRRCAVASAPTVQRANRIMFPLTSSEKLKKVRESRRKGIGEVSKNGQLPTVRCHVAAVVQWPCYSSSCYRKTQRLPKIPCRCPASHDSFVFSRRTTTAGLKIHSANRLSIE